MNPELATFAARIETCTTPESLFGKLSGDPLLSLKHLFRHFSFIAHEDRYLLSAEKKVAEEAFKRLTILHKEAQERIAKGIYGKAVATKPASIKTKKNLYTIHSGFAAGDFSNLYRATDESGLEVIIKMSRDRKVNPVLEREAQILPVLQKAAVASFKTTNIPISFPTLVESFVASNYLRGNVLLWHPDFRPLTELMAQYPEGVDPRHFVWIWNRVLTLLGIAHGQGIIHGSVLPTHILIRPDTHELSIVGWTFSLSPGSSLQSISSGYKSWYPPEVIAKRGAAAGTDIYMAARVMAYILGGEHDLPKSVPTPFRRFLDSCQLTALARRPTDALDLFDTFQDVAKSVYGPRRFVKLEMSPQSEGETMSPPK